MRQRPFIRIVFAALPWLFLIPDAFARELTFEDRVNAQEAIERVYYSHQIGATKPFEGAVPRDVLENKVRIYLKQTVALETYWKTPVTAQALSRELERMARNTRLPDRLREIYSALGNDRQLILECLARPALVDRLARNFFAYDETIHGASRQKAEDVRASLLNGTLSINDAYPFRTVINIGRARSGPQLRAEGASSPSGDDATPGRRVDLDTVEYSQMRAPAPTEVGEVGAVTEEQDAFVIRVVLDEAPDFFSLATYAVPKTTWDEWWALRAPDVDDATALAVEGIDPDMISMAPNTGAASPLRDAEDPALTCNPGDTWDRGVLEVAPERRTDHTSVWTGAEMIVWGGVGSTYFNSGGRYDPATDTWYSTSTLNAPTGRGGHTAVWSGSEMIIWGGADVRGNLLNSGGRYNPATDTWSAMSTTDALAGRKACSVVWTGTEMILWGGYQSDAVGDGIAYLASGSRYNPTTDAWSATATTGAPSGRIAHTAVWTGRAMVIWGGMDATKDLISGGVYDPATDTWFPTSTANAPTARWNHSAVWSGTWMIVWGGLAGRTFLGSGGRYDPATDTWTPTSTLNIPEVRIRNSAIWTGTEMIVWGGVGGPYGFTYLNSGGRYNPSTNNWIPTSMTNAPTGRFGHTTVWTGHQMIVWGGDPGSGNVLLNSGGRYDPNTDTWSPTNINNGPAERNGHTAVWTGGQMIVWGGGGAVSLNSGSRYDPATDTWSATSLTNAPAARAGHTAVWTGHQMIVWGGGASLSSGGRYDPLTDTWSSTSTTAAPSGRSGHSVVWTGAQMIVWGGRNAYYTLNSGGRYDPIADTWSLTATANAPSGRTGHSAVWTGREMLVWAGWDGYVGLLSGGRYDPAMNTWSPISTGNAPTGLTGHTAVWTGTGMIVWGGLSGQGYIDMNSGSIYDPTTDSWTPTSITNAPMGRDEHTAVWTGAEMIVWGGVSASYLDTGGRYDPAKDSWLPVSTVNGPTARLYHTAVWTGNEMIIWGGMGVGAHLLGSGGRYSLKPSFDPPIADAGPDRAVECIRAVGTAVDLHGVGTGCGSFTYTWMGPFAEGGGRVQGSDAAVTLPLGRSSITLKVDDAHGQSTTDTFLVDVQDTMPPALTCSAPLVAECAGPDGAPLSPMATAVDACSPSVQITNTRTSGGADAFSSYALGTTPVTFSATDSSGNVVTCTVPVTVKDTTPPTLTVLADPPSLWPPNHELVPVNVAGQVRDICDPSPAAALVAVTSSEADDAPGTGDGITTGDVAGADLGTQDMSVDLRAERNGSGAGRVYQLTYKAVDASGNTTLAFAVVTVPHDQGSGPEPLLMRLEPDKTPGMVRIYWAGIPGAEGYDVISGELSQVKVENGHLSMGAVRVLARVTTETSLTEGASGEIPAMGATVFYLIQSHTDRGGTGYGTESAPWPRVPASCDAGCP